MVTTGVHVCTGQMSPLPMTEHGGFTVTGEGAGSLVDMTGHHPSLNDVTLRRRVMTAPRQSPAQHPAQHPSLCSRDEGGSGGHSFQQPSSPATGTPVSINRLTWGHQ